MAPESLDHNRMLLEIDRTIRDLNRSTINPMIPELTLNDLCPVMELVARARGLYLKELFEVTEISGDQMPSQDQIGRLKKLRENFEELVKGAQALETAIERGYLDVNR